MDYGAQADFLRAVFRRWGISPPADLLALACASGLHARRLIRDGYRVLGVDRSRELLRQAAACCAPPKAQFVAQDMRALGLRRRFDAVYCLNHTLNYMIDNADLRAVLGGAHEALRPGGLFIFDFLSYDPPADWALPWTDHVKQRGLTIRMKHEPEVDWVAQVCTDRHTYEVRHRGKSQVHRGVDRLRIALVQDMAYHARSAGFEVLQVCGKWELDSPAGDTGAAIVARRPGGEKRGRT